jgi:threonine dehydrogenase-like Zn-dependent dehydrogenase
MWTYTVSAPSIIAARAMPAPTEADLGEGQLLLRVLTGGICGSDLPFFRGMAMPQGESARDGWVAPPGGPMHEVAGEVVAATSAEPAVGSMVVGWATSWNGMSEYIVVDATDVHAFSTDLSPSPAIALQPLACVLHAVDSLEKVEGSHVAVIGQGSIGVLFSRVLKSRGAARVTGIDRVDRSDVATAFGVDEMVWAGSDRWAAEVGAGSERPDIIIEAVGHQVSTLVDAVTALADGGQIYYFGIPDDPIYPFPMMRFLRLGGRLHAGVTPPGARRESLRRAEAYLAATPELSLESYITHTFPFAQAQEAFEAAGRAARGRLKVTLEG